jgi:ferredoxin--NADP+ reductase
MRLDDYDTSQRFDATVLSSERITPESTDEVREIMLEVDRPDFRYRIGQSVGVLAPGDPSFGRHDHFRLYSVADLPETDDGDRPRIKICVKRCTYVDDYSGERYPGIASNFLCDRRVGDHVTLSGPYGLAFPVPEDHAANLILIGTGTGIAPFRALVKHIYRDVPDWTGQIRLFYGARSGLELLYMNDEKDDFTQYYDHETFEAIHALSPRPHWNDPIAWGDALGVRAEEIRAMLEQPKTVVYVAGLEEIRDQLDEVLSTLHDSKEAWLERKEQLVADGRWVELIY